MEPGEGIIDDDELEEAISTLVHPAGLPKLREAHEALGEGLGVGETYVEPPDGQALLEALRQLSRDVAEYAHILSGSVDTEDPESTARFLSALAPLDQHRAKHGRAPSAPVDTDPVPPPPVVEDPSDPDPDAPLPPVE